MLVLAMIVVVGFFLPWMRIESEQLGALSKVLTGRRQEIVDNLSGFRIPILANSPDARLVISVAKIFKPDIKDVDKKSYLVWLVPILAVLLLGLAYFFGKNKWFNLFLAILGISIFVIAFYKIKTTDLDKMVLRVSIDSGLWLVLYAYLAMGILGLGNFIYALFLGKNKT